MLVKTPTALIRFAGDSGDGIQAIGKQMATTVTKAGNHICTEIDFPAEIRAPAGTLKGISSFKLGFATQKLFALSKEITVLVAFNPAALKSFLAELKPGGILIIDLNKFTQPDWEKAHYANDPLIKELLTSYQVISLPITELSKQIIIANNLPPALIIKCKNMFILGVIYYLYDLSLTNTLQWINTKFQNQDIILANQAILQAGYSYAANNSIFSNRVIVESKANDFENLSYITGNKAFALASLVIAQQTPKGVFAAGYPITPASEILQELAKYPELQVTTFQAEDEIAAMSASLGAAFGGAIAITCTSGPGLDLKQEAIGLAVMAELPVIIIDVQRAGPSTGMPTKTEQSDLTAAMYGRHGESAVVILAPNSASDCFTIMLEATQIAVKYMVPVIILSDANLANNAESWILPKLAKIPKLVINYCQPQENFQPYTREQVTLARPWAIPGTYNLTHRIGGLEKQEVTGEVSYDSANHSNMVQIRANKITAIAKELPATNILGIPTAKLLIIGWGSSFGVIQTIINSLIAEGYQLAYLHLRYLNPLPNDLRAICSKFQQIVVIEANLGQLTQLLRAKYLLDIKLISQMTGKQFSMPELKTAILNYLT